MDSLYGCLGKGKRCDYIMLFAEWIEIMKVAKSSILCVTGLF